MTFQSLRWALGGLGTGILGMRSWMRCLDLCLQLDFIQAEDNADKVQGGRRAMSGSALSPPIRGGGL